MSDENYQDNYTRAVMDSVQVPRAEYEKLKKDSRFLGKLFMAGVDNWDGYSEACEADEKEDRRG